MLISTKVFLHQILEFFLTKNVLKKKSQISFRYFGSFVVFFWNGNVYTFITMKPITGVYEKKKYIVIPKKGFLLFPLIIIMILMITGFGKKRCVER